MYGVMEITNLFPLCIQKRDPLLDMTRESRALYETFDSKNFDEISEIALMTRGRQLPTVCIQRERRKQCLA